MRQSLDVLRRILRLRRRGWQVGLAVLALLISTLGMMAVPWIGGRIIDSISASAEGSRLLRWTLLLAGAAVVSAIARGGYRVLFVWWKAASVERLRQSMLDHLQAAEVAVFERRESGLLTSLFSNDAAVAGGLFHPVASSLLQSIFQLVAILVIVSTQYSAIAWTLVPLIPLYLAFPLAFSGRIRRASQRLQETRAEALSGVQETLEGVREVKALERRGWSARRLGRRFRAVVGGRVRLEGIRSLLHLQYALYWILLAFMYWWGGQRVFTGELTVGELVAFIGYAGYVNGPVSRLVNINTEFHQCLAAARRIVDVFDEPREDGGGERALPAAEQGLSIELDDVTFRYAADEEPALDGVSAHLEAGSRIGLVGPSGAGKSTLINLLLRFHDPQGGRIRLAGHDLREYDLASLRSGVGLVFQAPFLFSGSVRENLLLGDPEATDAQVREAARIANAAEFIEELPDGYDTEIGEKGNRLSGGQKQRLAIARVALGDPRILILDEATSALDARSDRLVRDALENLMAGRTSIAIAHRLSTVVHADQLLLLDRGRLVATGSHDELVEESGLYRRLCSLQLTDGAAAGD